MNTNHQQVSLSKETKAVAEFIFAVTEMHEEARSYYFESISETPNEEAEMTEALSKYLKFWRNKLCQMIDTNIISGMLDI